MRRQGRKSVEKRSRPSQSSTDFDPKIRELQSQLNAFEAEVRTLEASLTASDKKQEIGGSLFIAGSGLLLLTMISFPFLNLLISLVLIFVGVVVAYFGRSDNRESRKKLSESNLHISRIKEELQSLQ